MRRSRLICIIAFLFTGITVVALTGFMIYLVVIRNPPTVESVAALREANELQQEERDPNSLSDHRSHSKPGTNYSAIDVLGTGEAVVLLDGQRSHTHYYDVGPPSVVGNLVSYVWFMNKTHEIIGTDVSFEHPFPVGKHRVGLTVADNTRDTHTAYTTVEIFSSIIDGVYCYYYRNGEINPDIGVGNRPFYADRRENLTFTSKADFPENVRGGNLFARFVFSPKVKKGQFFKFQTNANIKLYCNGSALSDGGSGGKVFRYVGVNPEPSCELIYKKWGGEPQLDVEELDDDDFKHDFARVVPVISSITPGNSTLDGGGRALIKGIALNTNITVFIDNKVARMEKPSEDGTEVTVFVPKFQGQGDEHDAWVKVRNRNGFSNSIVFTYSSDGPFPIKFKKAPIVVQAPGGANLFDLVTGIKYGPDHWYHLTSMHSRVMSFKLTDDFKVKERPCKSESLGLHRVLLGLAFNPRDFPKVRLYVSSSILFWRREGLLSGDLAWANGQVHVLEKNGRCLKEVEGSPIITGLPVSNHDHGVNGMVFDDQGRLHILVGGFTNAGQNFEAFGGVGENPLSAASLVAEVERRGFNGKITYNPTVPDTAWQRSAREDVRVWFSGLRNSFGINYHSNGKLYAMDNGPSTGYGAKSVDCKTHGDWGPDEETIMLDKLHWLREGHYGGHPNRNRGRNMTGQCVYHSILDTKPNLDPKHMYVPPLATLKSSTNGVVEYMSNAFNGPLKGDLILTMFASKESQGEVWRVELKNNGEAVKRKPSVLLEQSGIAADLTPQGGIIMARVHRAQVIAFVPDVKTKRGLLVSVMPNRGPPTGKYWVRITARNLGVRPRAYFGPIVQNRKCSGPTQVKDATPDGFMCLVPAFSDGEATSVMVNIVHYTRGGVEKQAISSGNDFRYTDPYP